MRIAILVWGSLYWDPRNLEKTDEWYYDGPVLPIEFARISGGNRLTLVIKPNFDFVPTLYAVSSNNDFIAARENLQSRENTPNIENIGFINFTNNTHHVRSSNVFILDILTHWNIAKKFDAIIWSDFQPRFTNAIGSPFTLENVITFLSGLSEADKVEALKYIRNAPPQITTPFRKTIEEHFK